MAKSRIYWSFQYPLNHCAVTLLERRKNYLPTFYLPTFYLPTFYLPTFNLPTFNLLTFSPSYLQPFPFTFALYRHMMPLCQNTKVCAS
jgi:hypothetical protein